MNLSAYEIALIAGGFTVVGTLLGVWLAYRFSLSLASITQRHRATLKLREAFKDEILAVNPAQYAMKVDLAIFLENAFPKHSAAIFDFAYFLESKERIAFYAAWYEYHCHRDQRNENCIPFFAQYSCQGFTTKEEHEMKILVRNRIQKILEFAKPK